MTSSTAPSTSHYDSDETSDASNDRIMLTSRPLEGYDLLKMVVDPSCGGVSSFIGTTRDSFEAKRVTYLQYEAFEPMAVKEMKGVCTRAREKWDLCKVALLHRLGAVDVCEASVMIAVSSVHRKDCLEAVHWMIDELKTRVPIWKKEMYTDGSAWKENHEFHPSTLLDTSAAASSSTTTSPPDDGIADGE